MASRASSQRGASRSSRSTTSRTGRTAGGASARARKGATTSSSPRKARTAAGSSAKRSSARAARRSSLTPALVLAAVALLAWAIYPALRIQYQTGRRVAGLQAEYDALKRRNQQLRAEVAELKEPEGIERAARQTLGLTKPGENVYVVLPAEGATSQPVAQAAPEKATDIVTAVLDTLFGVRR